MGNNSIVVLADELANAQRNLQRYDKAIAETMAREIRLRDEWAEKERAIRDKLVEMFQDPEVNTEGLTKVENDWVSVSYRKPTERRSIDMDAFRAENPDLYNKYERMTPVKASVVIKVKG